MAAAAELFYARGYEATSLKQVAVRAGVHGGSLFHFFPSKSELVEAVLRRYLDLLDPVLMIPARSATDDPVGQVLHVLGGYRAHLIATGFSRGCPIGGLALELAEKQTRARELVAENFSRWQAAIAQMLAGVPLVEGVSPEEVAAFALTVMEGAVMQARSYRSAEPFDLSIRQFEMYLRAVSQERA